MIEVCVRSGGGQLNDVLFHVQWQDSIRILNKKCRSHRNILCAFFSFILLTVKWINPYDLSFEIQQKDWGLHEVRWRTFKRCFVSRSLTAFNLYIIKNKEYRFHRNILCVFFSFIFSIVENQHKSHQKIFEILHIIWKFFVSFRLVKSLWFDKCSFRIGAN